MHSLLRLLAATLLAAALTTLPARAQELPPADTSAVEDDAEAALDDLESGAEDSEPLAEDLLDLAENPLDLNTASAEELAFIPALSPLVAGIIVRFREQFGAFRSVEELRAVEGVTAEVYAGARPYVTVRAPTQAQAAPAEGGGEEGEGDGARLPRFTPPLSFGELTRTLRGSLIQRYTRRLDLGEGYDDPVLLRVSEDGDSTFATRYGGSPARLYTRLRLRSQRRFSLNLTLDKDPGEPFGWDPDVQRYGYDYLSAHAAIRDFGRIKTLIVGDYTAEFGQGVALWRSFAFGKGRDPVRPVLRSGRGLVAYGSTEENRFFRGAAGTFFLTPRLELSAFASRRTLDATLLAPDTTAFGLEGEGTGLQATTLSTSGLHRTDSEIARKDALGQTLYGGALEYGFGSARVGAVGYHSRFDRPIVPGDRAYRRFRFSGEEATMLSLYASVPVRGLLFFGEGGRAPSGALGGLGGVMAGVGRGAEAVVLARHFPRDFDGLHGYAFGERNGTTQNETGIYTALRLRLDRAWAVAGYFDQYRFPWVRFSVPRPSAGYDARLVIEHEPRAWLAYYVQLRSETQDVGADVIGSDGRLLDGLARATRQSARLHGDYEFSRELRLRARAEVARYEEEGQSASYGLILYQDVRWQALRRLQLDARLAFFDTDDFDARVYAYENDLLYTFSVPAFFGQGQRAYLLAKYDVTENLTLQAKYAATRFQDVDTVGSGLDEVEGNRLREIRAQVRWTF